MNPAELQLVLEASRRERGHMAPAIGHLPPMHCYCDGCRVDRETIADAAQWLLERVDKGDAIPRRAHDDFGDID